jgi:hypothetical protein
VKEKIVLRVLFLVRLSLELFVLIKFQILFNRVDYSLTVLSDTLLDNFSILLDNMTPLRVLLLDSFDFEKAFTIN